MMWLFALALTAALQDAPAPAAAPAGASIGSLDQQIAQRAAELTQAGFSPAAVAILSRPPEGYAAQQQSINDRESRISAALGAAIEAQPFDLVTFQKLLRETEALRVEVEQQRIAQIASVLAQLPEADARLFARSLITTDTSQASPAEAPAQAQ